MSHYSEPDKNRILAAFRREKPDRTLNFEVLVDNPTVRRNMGRELTGGHILVNIDPLDYLESAKKIGQDVIGMRFYDNPFKYIDERGEIKRLDYSIQSKADLDKLLTVDDSHMEPLFTRLSEYRHTIENTDVGLFALTGSFFTNAYNSIFGFENFMCMLYDHG